MDRRIGRAEERLARAPGIDRTQEQLLRPILSTGKGFYIFIGALLILIGWFGYAWVRQLTEGLGVTAMRTPVGAAWGLYITHFIFFVGIAHGGIAISAGVRLLKLTKYMPVARMGEVVTIISLMMAGLSIMIDMGRPDRIFNMVRYWPERVGSSPLSWDVTVIIIYFTISACYLWLTLRRDLARCLNRFPRLSLIYRALLIGYKPGEEEKIDRMAWWLSIAVIILIVMLSGGVIPWIFGLLSSRPGWFGALAGPYFLTAALTSSIAMVVIVATILRRLFNWQTQIKPEVIKGLGTFLGILTLLYMYMILAEQITLKYSAPHAEAAISEMMLQGDLAPVFWPMLIGGFMVPAIMLIVQALRPKWFSITGTFAATTIILVAFWIKRFIIVVPSLLRPLLPFPGGSYDPSWIEWSIIIGIFALAVLLYTIFLKIFPIVELSEE